MLKRNVRFEFWCKTQFVGSLTSIKRQIVTESVQALWNHLQLKSLTKPARQIKRTLQAIKTVQTKLFLCVALNWQREMRHFQTMANNLQVPGDFWARSPCCNCTTLPWPPARLTRITNTITFITLSTIMAIENLLPQQLRHLLPDLLYPCIHF